MDYSGLSGKVVDHSKIDLRTEGGGGGIDPFKSWGFKLFRAEKQKSIKQTFQRPRK
jgi:hypothetical protein